MIFSNPGMEVFFHVFFYEALSGLKSSMTVFFVVFADICGVKQ